jgi:hypothetical protein
METSAVTEVVTVVATEGATEVVTGAETVAVTEVVTAESELKCPPACFSFSFEWCVVVSKIKSDEK